MLLSASGKNFLLNQLRTAVITDEPFVTDCKKLASNEKEETDKKRPNLWIEINDADEIQLIPLNYSNRMPEIS